MNPDRLQFRTSGAREGGFTEFKYRPEIDGLRAVAVVPVIFFHAGFSTFSGGFVGVDVFFVISGYLITSLIWREMEDGRFSIVRFYERRARRILPALFLVSLACLPFAWFWMFPQQLDGFARSLLATNLFASNILFWRESGYFSEAAELKPLLHTWSLAVEEQFYIFFPILLLALVRLGPRHVLRVIIGLSFVSLIIAEFGSRFAPSANFYLLPSRIWELGAGAILALTIGSATIRHAATAQALSALGIALIIASIILFDETTRFPSLWTMVPVAGSVLIIAAAGPSTFVGRALSWKPMMAIGLISYSAYLWHQPLFAFARIRAVNEVPAEVYWVLVAATLILATLSWRFVEQPFRRRGVFGRAEVFGAAALGGAFFISVSLIGITTRGVPDRWDSETVAMLAYAQDFSPHRFECHNRALLPEDACVLGAGEDPPMIVWGDSHGVELAWRLAERFEQYNTPVRQLTTSACLPALGLRYEGAVNERCTATNEAVFEYLTSINYHGGPVVLVARWSLYFEGRSFTNDFGVHERDAPVIAMPADENSFAADSEKRKLELGILIGQTVADLRAAGRKVILVYPIPEAGWSVPETLVRRSIVGAIDDRPLSTSYELYRQRSEAARRALDEIPDGPDLLRVDPAELFCNMTEPGRCSVEASHGPLYWDDDHLNSVGAGMLAAAIQQGVSKAGR